MVKISNRGNIPPSAPPRAQAVALPPCGRGAAARTPPVRPPPKEAGSQPDAAVNPLRPRNSGAHVPCLLNLWTTRPIAAITTSPKAIGASPYSLGVIRSCSYRSRSKKRCPRAIYRVGAAKPPPFDRRHSGLLSPNGG